MRVYNKIIITDKSLVFKRSNAERQSIQGDLNLGGVISSEKTCWERAVTCNISSGACFQKVFKKNV